MDAVRPDRVLKVEWTHTDTEAMNVVLQVRAYDRRGLLRDLTASLSSLNLNIASAHIVTFGEKAVDSFYVTDLTGQKINAPARQAAIRRRMLADFAAD